MPGKIFINYRRDDAIAVAGRLHDRLAQAFGHKSLFMDVDHIPAGIDFVDHLNAQVAACDVFLAVMGPHWIDAKDKTGHRRIDNPKDFVAIEIAAALARKIRVIPVLVDGAGMPNEDDLPEALKPLVRRNAVELRNAQFGRDAEALIEKVRAALKAGKPTPTRWPVLTASAVALVLAGWLGAYQLGVRVPWASVPEQPDPSMTEKAKAEAKRLANLAASKTTEFAANMKAKAGAEIEHRRVAAAEEAKRKADGEAAPRVPQAGETFRDCPTCPEIVVVPAGSFTMGSPSSEPGRDNGEVQLKVTIAGPFAVGKFAVTFDEWDACVADGGCKGYRPDDRGWGRGKRPVINVSWDDARGYTTWLSHKTGKTYRPLSEAEREYVTRAGTTAAFWWGWSIAPSQANYNSNYTYGGGSKGEKRQGPVPVDTFEPNPWGLYNVHGNVWEWTEDCWNERNYGNPGDGSARTSGDCSRRVVRGGSWFDIPADLRSAYRYWYAAVGGHNYVGFRVGMTLTP